MKKLLFVITFLLLTLNCYHAQSPIPGNITLNGSGDQIAKVTVIQNKKEGTPSYSTASYAIGKEFIPSSLDTTVKIDRTYLVFDLSGIPTNATITGVTVTYSTSLGSYSFKITQLASYSTSDRGANWSAIGSGSVLESGIAYNNSYSFSSTAIKTAIQNKLSSRSIILGAICADETANNSNSSLSLTLYITYTRPAALLTVQARNDLEGINGGNIGAAVYPNSAGSQPSPISPIPNVYETNKLNLAAYDNQVVNGVTWLFNDTEAPLNQSKWQKELFNSNTYLGGSASFTTQPLTTSDNGESFVAYLKRICNVNLQNSLPEGGGNIGHVYVDGTSRNVTAQVPKVKLNSITFYADNNQPLVNGIKSVFDHWSDGNTSSSRTMTVGSDLSYTCYYKGKASTDSRQLSINTTVGQPVTLTWHQHSSPNVIQYKIYRKVKPAGGSQGPETLIATINNMNTTTYVDNSYNVSNLYYYLLSYDVRYVYSGQCNGVNYTTESDPAYISTFGNTGGGLDPSMENDLSIKQATAKEVPSDYSIVNYPNPFNPNTVINYQLPTDGMVTLKVYDILGKEIATLVNDNRTAGYYSVEFNASNLPSGIYIYTINANNFTQSKKMLLMK